MAVTLKIDTSSKAALAFIEFVKTLPYVKVVEQNEKSPYDPEFVKKVKRAEKQKGKIIESGQSLWESL